jgi:hypothetical protein
MDANPTWSLPVGDEAQAGGGAQRNLNDGIPLPYLNFTDVEPSLHSADFVEGMLVSGAMSVVYGESNCGKTFFALDLALHIAEGRTWFGREITAGPVLYLALEGGNGIKNRIVAYRRQTGLDGTQLPFFAVTQSLNLLNPDGDLAAIAATAAEIEQHYGAAPVLIVIDTLSRAMAGGNENAPEDMTALVAAGDALRKHTGAHCMWIHHSGKDQARGARGHSSLRAATDTEIEVIADDSGRRAEVRKQRDLDGGDVIRFELQSVELGHNHRGKAVTSCVVMPADESIHRRDPAQNLSGQSRRAYEVLRDTIAAEGQSGFACVPERLLSIPDGRWRDEFYASAMPGAEQDARKKAFRRAADSLQARRLVALNGGRVWITNHEQPRQEDGT